MSYYLRTIVILVSCALTVSVLQAMRHDDVPRPVFGSDIEPKMHDNNAGSRVENFTGFGVIEVEDYAPAQDLLNDNAILGALSRETRKELERQVQALEKIHAISPKTQAPREASHDVRPDGPSPVRKHSGGSYVSPQRVRDDHLTENNRHLSYLAKAVADHLAAEKEQNKILKRAADFARESSKSNDRMTQYALAIAFLGTAASVASAVIAATGCK